MAAPALLFDVDGTLWDSYPWYADVLAGLSGQEARALRERLLSGASVITLARTCGVTDARLRSACARAAHGLCLYPGVRETLAEVASRGTPCGIVTSLSGRIVRPLLAALDLEKYFAIVIDGSVRPGKPHPVGLLSAVAGLGVSDRDGVYYVGDAARDALAARNAGLKFAWASYGYGDGCPPNADSVLTDFREVLQL